MKIDKIKIAIIGLGYVGLPLALAFGKKIRTIGYDKNIERILELQKGIDYSKEFNDKEILKPNKLEFTNSLYDLALCNHYVICVPTPIDENNEPDLSILEVALENVAVLIKKNDIIIFESTFYPGLTEDFCVPILEKVSGLEFNKDFFCGYSPERINPGDKKHRLENIIKITSGSNNLTANSVDRLYKLIIKAGTCKVQNIKTAEAAKVIENIQRDLNIALVNELSILFSKMEIDTEKVLKAAETKWNFMSFRPGLVGGHCIGVDPYYLTHKAKLIGTETNVILAGRQINSSMGTNIVNNMILSLTEQEIKIKNSKILIMGLTFKENCADTRNSGVFTLIEDLKNKKCSVSIFDPWVKIDTFNKENNINLIPYPSRNEYDGLIIAVAHKEFKKMPLSEIKSFCKKKHVIYDLKYLLDKNDSDLRL